MPDAGYGIITTPHWMALNDKGTVTDQAHLPTSDQQEGDIYRLQQGYEGCFCAIWHEDSGFADVGGGTLVSYSEGWIYFEDSLLDVATSAKISEIGTIRGIDNIPLSQGLRILVKDAWDPIYNGIYIIQESAYWTRSGSYDT